MIIYFIIILIIFLFINFFYFNNIECFNNNVNILHLLLYSDDEYYNEMYKLTSKYYKKFNYVKTIFYKFSNKYDSNYMLINDILFIKGEETNLPGILDKTIKAIEYFKDYNFDYLIRSNVSTIINFDLLISQLNVNIHYASGLLLFISDSYEDINYGVIKNIYSNTHYASGTNIILSKKLVNKILLKKNNIDYNVIDDVSIGYFIKNNFPDIKLFEIKNKFTIVNESNINNLDYKNIIFYRNRNTSRLDDVKNMKYIISNLDI
jgi:hypothetical protein